MKTLSTKITYKLTKKPTLLSVSDSVEDILDFNANDFLTERVNFHDIIHIDDQGICAGLFSDVPFPSSGTCTIRIRKKNHRICIVRLDYIKNTNSNDIELELSLYDVKSLYKGSLKDSLTVNFESMMENTKDYIYFKNHNHVFTGASQSLVSLCNPIEHWADFLGQTDYDVFPEEYADKYFNLERAVFSGKPVAQEIQKTLSTDGKEGWVDNHKYPIHDKQGEIIGLFGVARDITEQKLAENYAFHQGNYDSLTDLPNRALFFDRLSIEISKARRSNNSIALLFLDLDGFKEVNDIFGHDAGDQVLVSATQRWLVYLRDTDTLARIGGDEFAIIISDIQDSNVAGHISKKMINALSSTISLLSNQECQIGVSIGISMYPENATEMDSLVSAADAAMYVSKAKGKNTVSFSDIRLGCSNKEWMHLNSSLLVRVDLIDEQHNKIVELTNEINFSLRESLSSEKVDELFKELIEYTVFHFETEHKLMLDYSYPNIEGHDLAHESLFNQIQYISKQHLEGNPVLLLQTIKDWLIKHVQNCDKDLGRFIMSENNKKTTR